tara:strand:- start:338 stop:508 length:171 start_codon:yes stop_codon:yes gene_type:complete
MIVTSLPTSLLKNWQLPDIFWQFSQNKEGGGGATPVYRELVGNISNCPSIAKKIAK